MLFIRNEDIYKNAYPNWQKNFRSHDEFLALYSSNFKESADKLILSHEGSKNHSIDNAIIPIIYLYRHSMELCLKAILYKSYINRKLDREKIQSKLNSHNLEKLWDKLTNELNEYYSFTKDSRSKQQLRIIKDLILELNNFDPGSINFRYPFDKKLEENIYGDGKENFGIDYLNMKNEFDNAYTKLHYWIYENMTFVN
ncbi:hypothetical protein [Bacillus inaquosorum]|uniref:hypothetical protein n=1 Tax=Bacillus inaquosorum TaxID=483913 RepID=UPI00227F88FD|nr:hypothetical protein [Bacillus inaquosorum]MCY9456810.1 hypothetical protein [Bacillus inaquosorum]